MDLLLDTLIVLNRGGTRSSKTYSICQLLLLKLVSEKNKRFLIARKTFPALANSVLRDMVEMLKHHDIYKMCKHNLSNHTLIYLPTGSEIVFASIDDSQKFRGAEWNYVWLNEANEFKYDDFTQIYLRMSRKSEDDKINQIYLDFNPSDMFNWTKTEIEDKNRAKVITSTFRDNTFLDQNTINRIEWLKDNDESFWRIYGLGEYTNISGLVYENWATCEEFPDNCKWISYGMDFGYSNDPTSLIKVGFYNSELYISELIYETKLTNQDLGHKIKEYGLTRQDIIYADSAEPKSIEELYRMGLNVKPSKKGRDSIVNGIDVVKRYKINIVDTSLNTIKEIRSYKWEEDRKGEKLKNVPVAYNNHSMDALRYSVIMKLGLRTSKVRAFA